MIYTDCEIKHCKPELLKVGSFYEGTRNKFPDEFDYIIVAGTVNDLPIVEGHWNIDLNLKDAPKFKYISDQEASTFIEHDTKIGNTTHGPAATVTLSYSKWYKTFNLSGCFICSPFKIYKRYTQN